MKEQSHREKNLKCVLCKDKHIFDKTKQEKNRVGTNEQNLNTKYLKTKPYYEQLYNNCKSQEPTLI